MDPDRVERLFRDHAHEVLAYALRRVDDASAQDVVAEVFAVAWRRSDRIPDDQPALWLYAVARRVLANQRRAARRRSALHASLHPFVREHTTIETDDRFAAAMRSLSAGDRELLCLAAWEGLDAAQIAVVLGCSSGAAHTRLHRARRRLAARLVTEPEPSPEPTPEVASL